LKVKILITGASGFVGSWVTRHLAADHQVTALIRPQSSDFRLSGVFNLNIVRLPENKWADAIEMIEPELVILADWWGVENTYRDDPRQFDNIARFKSLVDVSIKTGVKQIIGVGSQAELGPVESIIAESQIDNPTTAYGKAKIEARKYLLENGYGKTLTTWLRIFSTYGPLDTGDWLIPNTVRNLLVEKTMDLTEGEQSWSYLHVADLTSAITLCVDRSLTGIINCGNPETETIRNVVSKIADIMDKKHLLNFGAIPYRHDQVMQMSPRCESLTAAGWKPHIKLDDGLGEVVKWLSGSEISNYFGSQIPLISQ
jgi:UDP-glucose 4-epimerase